MTARDINNKIIREADWVKNNHTKKIYQVHTILNNGILEIYVAYTIYNKKIKILKNPIFAQSYFFSKIDPPTAYNVTDNE